MDKKLFPILLFFLMSMVGTKALAYDFSSENADGITIYYNYNNNKTEVTVAQSNDYSGVVNIPEEVVYLDKALKVTGIGEKAFYRCYYLTSVTIPNNVTSIDKSAFQECKGMSFVTIGNSVVTIGESAFCDCSSLTTVTIPNSVISIERNAFERCTGITSLTLGDKVTTIDYQSFKHCTSLTSLTIPNSVTFLGGESFFGCEKLASVTIGNSVSVIGQQAFKACLNLSSVIIGNSVTTIGDSAFDQCYNLNSVNIPNSVTSIGGYAFCSTKLTSVTIPSSVTLLGYASFSCCDLTTVISEIEYPFDISDQVFCFNTFETGTLYVPEGTIDKYKDREGWKHFNSIIEGNGGGNNPPKTQKCEKPTIIYQNGILTFHSATEGAVCLSTITDADIATYTTSKVQLSVTYNISVYASKAGYENSETATATLCWIDFDPKTEGITNAVATIRANAVLIQSFGNVLSISGAPEGTEIDVYNLAGQKVGSAKAASEITNVITSLHTGEVCIVKIGEKTIKTVIR